MAFRQTEIGNNLFTVFVLWALGGCCCPRQKSYIHIASKAEPTQKDIMTNEIPAYIFRIPPFGPWSYMAFRRHGPHSVPHRNLSWHK